MRLTEDSIKRQKRPAKGQLLVWDDLVTGFGVRFTPTATCFVVQWRDSAGRKPRESLRPRWPSLSVEAARTRARQRLSSVVTARETGADVPLRLAMRQWYEQQTTRGTWGVRYRTKVDSIINCYVEGNTNARVRLTPIARKNIDQLGKKGRRRCNEIGHDRRCRSHQVRDGGAVSRNC